MVATTKHYTADDLWELSAGPARYELIEGELIEMSPTGFEHSDLALDLGARVWSYLRSNPIGRASGADGGYRLQRDPDIVLAPDISFVQAERLPPRHQRKKYLELAPDLAVEVVSPSDSAEAVTRKVLIYLKHGTKLVWVVEPDQRVVTIYRQDRTAKILTTDDILDGEEVLPGFTLPVAELFQGLDQDGEEGERDEPERH
jgi:Uma2 family endonuclease